jgi:hypothetical protein
MAETPALTGITLTLAERAPAYHWAQDRPELMIVPSGIYLPGLHLFDRPLQSRVSGNVFTHVSEQVKPLK